MCWNSTAGGLGDSAGFVRSLTKENAFILLSRIEKITGLSCGRYRIFYCRCYQLPKAKAL